MPTELKQYNYKYPNESFSGCDMVATIVYGYEKDNNYNQDDNLNNNGKSKVLNNAQNWNIKVLGEIQTISYSIHMERRPVRSIGNVNAKDYVMGPRTIAGSLVFAVFNKHFAEDIIRDNNNNYSSGTAYLVDELPPFNIVISMANEYGIRSKLVIYGVRLLNEGQVMSVNDVYTENTYQFVATDVEYLNSEVTYASRTKYNGLIKIKDILSPRDPEFFEPLDTKVNVSYHDPNNPNIEHIIMNIKTIDASYNNSYGKAIISLSPIQNNGELTIFDSNNNKTIITVDNKNSYSIDLLPDIYNVSFNKSNIGEWTCASKSFIIKPFNNKYDKKKYAPIVESITDTSISIYSNEYTHTHVIISNANNNIKKYYELKNRRLKINDLKRNTYYSIATCIYNKDLDEEYLTSPYIKIKTLTVFEKPFNDFIKLIETNTNLLKYNDLNRYFEVIEEAKKKAINNSNFESPTNSIIELKKDYELQLKNLDKEANDYNINYDILTYKIFICNELIYLSNKVQNNIISITNKDTNIPMPKLTYNKAYDTVFIYDKNIEKSEFFRLYKNMAQSAATVYSNTFTNLDDNNKYFLFKGKSGTNHYVQSLIDNKRSAKLEFYEMTIKEKQDKIDNETYSENDINKINSIILDEINDINCTNSSLLDRLFMVKVKNIDNPKILAPNILNITEDYIEVETNISNLIADNSKDFYLAINTKDNIINNDFIYKHKFNSNDNIIKLDDIDYALYNNQDYCLYIEDENFNQISNITTFTMNKEKSLDDRFIFEYEINNLVNRIKYSLKDLLSVSIYETLCSYIEYNEEINKLNIIDITLDYIFNSGLSHNQIINCLTAIKDLIGIFAESDDIITNINYSNKLLSYQTSKEVNSIVISYGEEVNYKVVNNNIIDISNLKANYVIIIGISNDLLYKTDLILINNNTNKMEVI